MPGPPEHAPAQGANRSGFRLSRAAAVVLVVMTAVSVLLWVVTSRLVEAQESEILEHRTDQVRESFTTRLESVLAALEELGRTISPESDPATVARNLPAVLRAGGFTSMALVDTTTSPPTVLAGTAGLEPGRPLGPEATAVVEGLSAADPLSTAIVSDGADRRLGVAQAPLMAPEGQALYGEVALRGFDPATARLVFGDPADIDAAVYAGTVASRDSVVYATTDAIPFGEPVATTEIPVGSGTWILQGHPRVRLLSPPALALPWIVLAGGLLATVLMAIVVEIASRRRDDALAFAAAQARESISILDAAQEAFVVVDDRGRIARWSGQAERLLGWSAEEAVGRSAVEMLVPPELRELYGDALAAWPLTDSTSGEGAGRFEGEVVDRSGRRFPMEVSVWRSGTDPSRVNVILHDISERRRAADELADAHEQALAASRMKSEFVATMSHEIRTPMNAVIGMTALLLRTPLDDEQREYAETVRTSAESLLTVVNDILDFSKIEAGKLTIEQVDFDPRHSVAEIRDLLTGQARAKGLELVTVVEPEVPMVVHGDPTRLRQVLINLAGNAVKFTDEGEVVIHCSLETPTRAGADSGCLRFEVRDTGVGVRPEQLEHLFSSFIQADSSTTRRYGGTGLGLTIARQLTELMGGRIGATSRVGTGSTFWFTIEIGFVSDDVAPILEDVTARVKPLTTAPDEVPPGIAVLVAEDNPVNQRVALRMLEKLGCSVEVVANGEEAVRAVLATRYDMVFMDCQMPEKDGYEATREIRRREPPGLRTPIIAMTAAAMAGDRERTIAAGMDDYVAKPVRIAELTAAVQRWAPEPEEDAERVPEAAPASVLAPDPAGRSRTSARVDLVTSVSTIDIAAVDELRALVSGANGGLSSLTAELSAGAGDQLRAMAVATGRGDLDLVAHTARILRGTTTTLGAVEASADADSVERAARDGDVAQVLAGLDRLAGSLERASAEVQRLVSD